MAALSSYRDTKAMQNGYGYPEIYSFPVKDTVKIYKGALVVLDAGYLKPAVAESGKVPVGIALDDADNSTTVTGHADGFVSCRVRRGTFKFDNKSNDQVVAADVGASCYIGDDHTVCHTSTTNTAVGKVVQIDSDGVWVQVGL